MFPSVVECYVKKECAIKGTVSSHFIGTLLGLKHFIKFIEIKANSEAFFNGLKKLKKACQCLYISMEAKH